MWEFLKTDSRGSFHLFDSYSGAAQFIRQIFRKIVLYLLKYNKGKHEVPNKRNDLYHIGNYPRYSIALHTRFLSDCYIDHDRLDTYNRITNFLGINLGRRIAFFIKGKVTERNKMVENLKKHTQDLIPELRKWAEHPLKHSEEPLFLLTQQHIKNSELWEMLEGSEGIRATQSRYDALSNGVNKQIGEIIKGRVSEKLPNLEIQHVAWFVEDIRDFTQKKIFKGKSYIFKVETNSSTTRPHSYHLSSFTADGSQARVGYQTGKKKNLKELANIMNNILEGSQFEETIRTWKDLGQQLHKKRKVFRENIGVLINNITYAVSDEDKILFGQCHKCEEVKRKLKMS